MISHNWGLQRASCDLLSHQSTNNENVIVIWNKTRWNWARSNLRSRESRNTQYPSLLHCPSTHLAHCMRGNPPTVIPSVRHMAAKGWVIELVSRITRTATLLDGSPSHMKWGPFPPRYKKTCRQSGMTNNVPYKRLLAKSSSNHDKERKGERKAS